MWAHRRCLLQPLNTQKVYSVYFQGSPAWFLHEPTPDSLRPSFQPSHLFLRLSPQSRESIWRSVPPTPPYGGEPYSLCASMLPGLCPPQLFFAEVTWGLCMEDWARGESAGTRPLPRCPSASTGSLYAVKASSCEHWLRQLLAWTTDPPLYPRSHRSLSLKFLDLFSLKKKKSM